MGDEGYDSSIFNWMIETRTNSFKSLAQRHLDGIMPAPEDPEPVASELEIRTSQVQTAEAEAERLRLGLMNLAQEFPDAHEAIERVLGAKLERADPPNQIPNTFVPGPLTKAQLAQAASRTQSRLSTNEYMQQYIQHDPEITQNLYREITKYGRD